MALDLDSGAADAAPSPTPPAAPARKKGKARPFDPEARERIAKRARVERLARKVEAKRTEAELEQLAAAPAEPPPATPPTPEPPPPARSETAEALWLMAQRLAEGTRFAINDQKREVLVVGTGPCLEKYLGGSMSVEMTAVVTVLAVFGAPLLEVAKEIAAERRRRQLELVKPPAGVEPAPFVAPPEAPAK